MWKNAIATGNLLKVPKARDTFNYCEAPPFTKNTPPGIFRRAATPAR